jgi:hypothetical protein
MQTTRPISGSKARDVILAALILTAMLLLAPRLRVYFQVTAVDIALEQVLPDDTRVALVTPDQFQKVGEGYWPADAVISNLRPKIDAYMKQSALPAAAPSGTRFDWTIRWSQNSMKLDHTEHIVWEVP